MNAFLRASFIHFLLVSFLSGMTLASANSGHDPASASFEELRGATALYRCSGAFVTLGQDDSEPGLVLAAGHCPAPEQLYPPNFAEKNRIVTDDEAEYVSFYVQKKSTDPKNPEPIASLASMRVRKVRYATMTNVDVALFETEATLGELKLAGHRIYRLADRLPKPGEKLRITSGLWSQTRVCTVDRILADNAEELAVVGVDPSPIVMKNSILMTKECLGRAGWSGAPLIGEEDGLIYGVMSRIPTDPKSGQDVTKQLVPGVIASSLVAFVDCVGPGGALDFDRPGCTLPKGAPPATEASEKPAPASKKSSHWPKSSARNP